MNLDELEYKAKIALAAFPNWTAQALPADHEKMRIFPWILEHKTGKYIPTLVANHIEATSPPRTMELIEEIRKRDALLERAKDLLAALENVPYDWTERASVTYREVQLEKSMLSAASAWAADLAKLK